MADSSIYEDIALRTDGDIYLGVVGPVRTGKSTFIKRFMETMVLPRIESEPRRSRAADELPQSAAGRTIMTTEPKFIPEEAVSITLEGNISLRVRMIDCVGYMVPSALGYIENQQPRLPVCHRRKTLFDLQPTLNTLSACLDYRQPVCKENLCHRLAGILLLRPYIIRRICNAYLLVNAGVS